MTRPRAQLLGAVGIGATLLVAAWLRLAYRPWVFVEGEVLPLGLDAYYHLRRMQQAAAGPLPLADPFLRWPQAAVVPWAPGFDHLGGLCLRLGGRPLAMALPVLLGLATVALVIHLARRLAVRTAPLAAGLGAGLVAALLPQAAAVAAVGRVDHHVAEVLTVAAFMAWALGSLEDRPRPLRQELLAAGVTFLGLWLFHGSVLYLGLAATVVGVGRAWRPRARLWGSGALGLLLASLALALAFRPATLAHGHALSFLYASYLQPLLVAVAALGVALGVAATRIGDEGGPWVSRGLAARRLALLAIGGLGLAALVVAIAGPELRAALSGWLARDERWMATIGETMPLLDDGGRRVHRYFGAFGLLAPLTLPVGLAVAYRARRATGLGLAAFSLALVGLSLLQARFGRAATLALALTTGLALAGAAAALTRRRPRLTVALVLAPLLLAVALDPLLHEGFRRAPRPMPAIDRAAIYLRDHSPPVGVGRGSGVLTTWDHGFVVAALGERPVLVGGFGPYLDGLDFARIDEIWRRDEAALLELLADHDARWVVAGAGTFLDRIRTPEASSPFFRGEDGLDYLAAPYFTALPLSPLVLGGSGTRERAHLGALMPVYATPEGVGGLSFYAPRLWVYERVAGAVLEGRSDRRRVAAELDLQVQGHALPYLAVAETVDGRFRLRLPLPTGRAGPVATADHYRLHLGGGDTRAIAITEADVREGRRVAF